MLSFAQFLTLHRIDEVWPENTLSVWCGPVVFVANVVTHATESTEDDVVREFLRPLAEVISLFGILMTLMILVRNSAALSCASHVASIVGHVAVGISAVDTDFTTNGVLVCVSVLVCVACVYFVFERLTSAAWPYPLAPAELAMSISVFLFLRRV